jgi:hypothetical protein
VLLLVAWFALGLALYASARPELQQAQKQEQRIRLEKLVIQELVLFRDIQPESIANPAGGLLREFQAEVVVLRDLSLQSKYARRLRTRYERQLQLAEQVGAIWHQVHNDPKADPWEAERNLNEVVGQIVNDKYYPLAQEGSPRELVRQALPDIMRWPGLISEKQIHEVLTLEAACPLAARVLLVDDIVTGFGQQVTAEKEAVQKLRGCVTIDILLGELPQ